jgi:methyl-accepting chemotaxis protein
MTIAKRIVAFISLVVLVVSFSLGVLAITIASGVVRRDAEASMYSQAEIIAALVAETIHSQLNVLQELANLREVRSMDFETLKAALINEISRIGADDFAVIYPDGNSPHLKDGQAPNLLSRGYVQKGLSGEHAVSDIIVGGSGAVATSYPLINYVVPIKVDGVVVGGLLARNNATHFSDIVKSIKTRHGGTAYLINSAGIIIAHQDTDLVMHSFSAIEAAKKDSRYATSAEVIQTILSRGGGSLRHDIEGKTMVIGFAPVPGFDMILVSMVEERLILHELSNMRNIMFIFVGFFMVLGIFAALLISRSVSNPMKKMLLVLNDIGDGDLTKRLEVRSKDEIGDMTRSFNNTLDKVLNLILVIRKKANSLSETGTELADNMNATAVAINEITANIQSMKTQVGNQSAEVEETGSAMEKISSHIGRLNEEIERQSESVSQSSSAIEEMLANIQSVTNTLVRNTDNVQNLAESSGVGHEGLEEVAADIQGIARESEGLLEINAVMENIASQTNLLSMNAAIEAAHAGEAGKGFAVVADEIRKLAESSGEQSKTIGGVLKRIKNSIDKITQSTQEVLKKFETIDLEVKVVSDQESNIRNAMEEQGQGSYQILDAVSRLNEITAEVRESAEEMNVGSKEVIETSRTLESITWEITNGMNEMAVGAHQINVAVNHVNEISGRNKNDIDELIQEVNRFKTE